MLLYDFKLFDKEKIKTETGIHYEPQCYITEYAWKRIRVHMGNKFNYFGVSYTKLLYGFRNLEYKRMDHFSNVFEIVGSVVIIKQTKILKNIEKEKG